MEETSITSLEKRGDFSNNGNFTTSEGLVTTEKVDDFLSQTHEEDSYEDIEKSSGVYVEDEEDSPIEEVRAVVSNKDDPTLPVYTFRMWFLGVIFTCVISFINQFFWFRKNALSVGSFVIQLISFPIGKLLEKVIPKSRFFNPGPFNIKEHILITTMAGTSASTAYAVDIFTIQRLFYGQNLGWGGGLLLIMTTQFIGYGLAGILRPYLVYPSAMVWPGNLASISLFRSFHEPANNWSGPSRMKWFIYCFIGMFIYYWLPGYFFQILTFFSWVCWIRPSSVVLSQITGSYSGLGVLAVSFDWATITSYLGSPNIVPLFAILNIGFGFVMVAWIIMPILYYTDVWEAKKFPILTPTLYNNEGEVWDNSLVLNSDRFLDPELYEKYGPLRMSTFFALAYGISFAGITSVIVHTILYHGKEIIEQWKKSRNQEDEDIHHKLMRVYPEVPQWWYITVFILSFGASFGLIYHWPIGLPWWGLILALAISMIFVLPIGIITAITNQTPGINVITEFIIGFALPGHPIANVTFKTYGYISMIQCLTFVSDLKLGHYTKIPPRAMFWVQTIGTAIAGVINLGTAIWLMDSVDNICTVKAYPFTCPSARTFYSASIIWGTIGPARMFGIGSMYSSMLWFFIIGLFIPIPFWLYSRKYPNSWVRYVHWPLIFGSIGMMPPAVPLNFSMWFLAGVFFMYYLRKYHRDWWTKYNYITSAAFNSGVAICGIVIFGVSEGTNWQANWWGNGGIGGSFDNCPLSAGNYSGIVT
ncbi:OPT family small oligopeptide transporter [Cokeromyces recurvatus]|uniref:OPT family small oligopeptide transporter n=1 Tax=Cokeromyces recurvatus TaxID=90255 RepID=UPI00221F90D9|nr:OPT family small oligopeptide transporter [Cokeromyces recurvatus]KAI7901113.1 OPT family small oligopeptide transporter [Cokeromyces recurvatus]